MNNILIRGGQDNNIKINLIPKSIYHIILDNYGTKHLIVVISTNFSITFGN